jgi:DNA polymerase elongation subunit (family B)
MEVFYRKKLFPVEKSDYNNNISFQITSWYATDETSNTDDSDSEESFDPITKKKKFKDMSDLKYVIRLFGTNDKSQSVHCKVVGFEPYFYIKVDESWSKQHLIILLKWIKFKLSKQKSKNFSNCLLSCEYTMMKDIYGFNNGKMFKFVKLTFSNKETMMKTVFFFKNKPIDGSRYWSLKNKGKEEGLDNGWAETEYTETGGKFEVVKIPNIPDVDKWVLYENKIEPYMRFAHIQDINMAGIVTIKPKNFTKISKTSNCQINIQVPWEKVISNKDNDKMNSLLQASFDIECYSHDYTFPKPYIKQNRVTQIASIFKYSGDTNVLVKHILVLKSCSPIKSSEDNVPVIVEEFPDTDIGELQLLDRWSEIIKKMDPDILYTWNGDGFDCEYMLNRYRLLIGCHHINSLEEKAKRDSLNPNCNHFSNTKFCNNLSRMKDRYSSYLKDEVFQSSAHGHNTYKRLYIPGRLNYDLHIHTKRGMKKYPYYNLNYIAGEILGESKNDVTPKQIFQFYENGKPDEIRTIAEYCIQDSELLQRLVDKTKIFVNICQMSNVTNVPIEFLVTRGQSIKVFSQIWKKARQMGFLVPSEIVIDRDVTFTGASVLPPLNGLYSNPIAVLDFASLYPTIMIAHNLCYSTFLFKDSEGNFISDNISDVNYELIEWEDEIEDDTLIKSKKTCENIMGTGLRKGEICGKQAYFEENCIFYCRVHDPEKKERSPQEKCKMIPVDYSYKIVQSQKGVIPSLLEELYTNRKKVKKLMNAEIKRAEVFMKENKIEEANNAKFLADIFDQQQLAIKVSLNSTYGVLGARHGLVIQALAAIVTNRGRKMIEQSKQYSQNIFSDFVKENKLFTDVITFKKLDLTETEKVKYLKMREI